MILEFIVNNLTRNERVEIITKEYIVNYHKMEMKIIALSASDIGSITKQHKYLAKKR